MSTVVDTVVEKLKQTFQTQQVAVTDNSWRHAGHVANPQDGTHLAFVIVSKLFSGKNAMQRVRLVHQALAVEMKTHIHALELRLLSPEEHDS
jgi:stress-induced morphogen